MDKSLNINMENLKTIYTSFLDEESKSIFLNRLLFSITNDYKYINRITKLDDFIESINKIKDKKFIMFGAGYWGQFIIRVWLKDVKWEYFVDNNIKNSEINGLKVISFEELKKQFKDEIIVISPLEKNGEIYEQLIKGGFSSENIINFGKMLHKKYNEIPEQYFEFPSENNKTESFVDAGCFDGSTSKKFVEWCHGNYDKIWAFEPDLRNYEVCKKALEGYNCNIYNAGVFDKDGIVCFSDNNTSNSKIDKDGNIKINTVKLDDILRGEKVSFIKMDIEGAEYKALQGTQEIIKTQKPKLAICVYHKPEDIIMIPELLLEYNKDYKFKLRHYWLNAIETVLYAF